MKKIEQVLEEANIAMIGALGRPRTVLDVGCGIGLNGAAAVMTGATVVGIERDPPRPPRRDACSVK